MILLIAGASHTGKTKLAQECLEEYQYPYLSIDHLKMGLIRAGHTKWMWKLYFATLDDNRDRPNDYENKGWPKYFLTSFLFSAKIVANQKSAEKSR